MNPSDSVGYDINDPLYSYYDSFSGYMGKYAERVGDKVRLYFSGKLYREFNFHQIQELIEILSKLQLSYIVDLNKKIVDMKKNMRDQDDIIEDLERQVEDLQ